MNNQVVQYRLYKEAFNDGEEFIEEELIDRFPKSDDSHKSMKNIISNSDDDFAHEDYFVSKWELEENSEGVLEWCPDNVFGKQRAKPRNGKGLLYTRTSYKKHLNQKSK
ncbi:hypothetical protein [Aquimarina sp. RZ0]|uniref:hypothetical protein n=1 Tax=Aquimarina sp. RZ0 TaxID=2607730 RepID=UPI0011F2986F|nr:hypothetical protein [Aquimarina sp. RZ0]KAA1244551.1 hypothetical protein F0000_16325 [Aquimarina sp. RZ0]